MRFYILICLNLILGNQGKTQDYHIDFTDNKTIYNISFSFHENLSFTAHEIDIILEYANLAIQNCDNVETAFEDVGCQIIFKRKGVVGIFDNSDAPLIVDSQSDEDMALNFDDYFVKIVKEISRDENEDGIEEPKYGIARQPSSTILLAAYLDNNELSLQSLGVVFAHEFLHAQGVGHRGESGFEPPREFSIMNAEYSNPVLYNTISSIECEALHTGFNSILPPAPLPPPTTHSHEIGDSHRPVDIAFVIDDTESMAEELDIVKSQVENFLDNNANPEDCNKTYQLITFKDNITVREPTTNSNHLKSQVQDLIHDGGELCPEWSLKATLKALEKVKDGGDVHLYTDASPTFKNKKKKLEEELNARNIKLHICLSSDCEGSTGFDIEEDYILPSINEEGVDVEPMALEAIINKAGSGYDIFSTLAEETNGVFHFIPEVNTSPEGQIAYGNAIENSLNGAFGQALQASIPSKAPRNSTLEIRIKANNTNFNDSTSIAFSEVGIEVQNIIINSPEELTALIEISDTTNLGFIDITSSTIISNGETEIATGIGILKITEENTEPTILSITPSYAKQGDTIQVTVRGNNTNFTNDSELRVRRKISVLSQNVINSELMTAFIHVHDTARVGVRLFAVKSQGEKPKYPFHVKANPDLPDIQPFISNQNNNAFIQAGKLHILPNPSNNKVNLKFHSEQAEMAIISIYDINGKLVFQDKRECFKGTNIFSLDIKNLSNGFYQTSVQTPHSLWLGKMVVNQ